MIACNKTDNVSPPARTVAYTLSGCTCTDSQAVFVADASLKDLAVSWNFGDGTTAATHQAVHQYTAPGTYTVTLTVKTDSVRTATQELTVNHCTPYASAASRTWPCDQTYFTTRDWPLADTTIYSTGTDLLVTYQSQAAVKILGDVLYYDKTASTASEVKFTAKTTYEERSLYYYPAVDSVKYFSFSRTGFSAYHWTMLNSR
jgi:PKD repeat protein